jgi:hypothetical protein
MDHKNYIMSADIIKLAQYMNQSIHILAIFTPWL